MRLSIKTKSSEFRFKEGWIKALFWVLEYEMENETE